MNLLKCERKIRCDIYGCKNLAEYYFTNKKFYAYSNIYLCKNCMQEMYKCLGRELVPASIKNINKKNSEIKE